MDAAQTGHEYRSQEMRRQEKRNTSRATNSKKEPLHKEPQKKIRILGSKNEYQGEPLRAGNGRVHVTKRRGRPRELDQ